MKSPSLARALFKVLQMQFDGDVSSEDLNVFTFCLATILLSRPYVDRASSLYSFSNTWALSPAKGLQEWLERVSRTRRNHAHSRQLDLAKCLNHQPLFANLVVGFFSVRILGTRLDCSSPKCHCRKVKPLRAVDTPLRKFMCLPLPFSRGIGEISPCHLNAMASGLDTAFISLLRNFWTTTPIYRCATFVSRLIVRMVMGELAYMLVMGLMTEVPLD